MNSLIALIKEKIVSLGIKDKLKQNLLKKIENLEKRIEAKKQKNAKILTNFKEKLSKQMMKGKIAVADVNELMTLVELLEAQSDSVALDADVLAQLKAKVVSLDVKVGLKSNLLKRIGKLENKQALTNALAGVTKDILKKAANGKISDGDAQALINLISQIESVI